VENVALKQFLLLVPSVFPSLSFQKYIIYKWKPFTGRPAGRPKSPWEDDIRYDMRRMQIVKWPEHVQDRPKWKVIVEKAKILPEL
jgi:hypothetical protein